MTKLKLLLKLLWNAPKIFRFNFKYLPFKQAIKLPIWLFNVKFVTLKGKVQITSDSIRMGMIRIGEVAIAPYLITRPCCVWENNGLVEFQGTCYIGSLATFTIGKHGVLTIGDNFIVNGGIKFISHNRTSIGPNTRCGWEVFIMDTSFHYIVDKATGKDLGSISKPIVIGANNWIGTKTVILKGAVLPNFCIVGACSLLNKNYGFPEYSMVAGNPPRLIREGVYRDLTR